jgi:hypothetical protein
MYKPELYWAATKAAAYGVDAGVQKRLSRKACVCVCGRGEYVYVRVYVGRYMCGWVCGNL